MNRSRILLACTLALPLWAHGYRDNAELDRFVGELVAEGSFSAEELGEIFRDARYQQSIIDAISRPAEKTLEWREYRKIFLKPDRIRQGVQFWRSHRDALTRAEAHFGVPASIVVAIVGVETLYGRRMGRYRVIDALSTLAFDYPPRSAFFRGELKQYLLLVREEGRHPGHLLGSYAGAMGYGQFIPSSYRNFAVDFDGDGKRDIWENAVDAIGSVANYLADHGWRAGEPITCRATLSESAAGALTKGEVKPARSVAEWKQDGVIAAQPIDEGLPAQPFLLNGGEGPEYWLSLPNFYAITRYNHSELYAMAVFQLGSAIEAAMAGDPPTAR